MKTRSGFVSNSSSQSFIIRGVEVDLQTVAEYLEINTSEEGLFDRVWDRLRGTLEIATTRDYFANTNDSNDDYPAIIGVSLGEMGDGVVFQIPIPDDTKIRKQIEEAIGEVGELNTYVQYVSNDNW